MENEAGENYTTCPRQEFYINPSHLLIKPSLCSCIIHLWNLQDPFPIFYQFCLVYFLHEVHNLVFKHIESHYKWLSSQPTNRLGEITRVEVARACQYLNFPNFGHVLCVPITTFFKSQKRLYRYVQILTCCPTTFPSLNRQLLLPKKPLILQVDSNLGMVLPFLVYATTWRSDTHGKAWDQLKGTSSGSSVIQFSIASWIRYRIWAPVCTTSPSCRHLFSMWLFTFYVTTVTLWNEKNVHFHRLWQNNASALPQRIFISL